MLAIHDNENYLITNFSKKKTDDYQNEKTI